MPASSPWPDVEIPDVDLWAFMFQRHNKDFPDDKVIYRSALQPERYYTYVGVKSAATAFGEGLQNLWDWQRGDVMAIYAPNDIDIPPLMYGVFFAGGIVSPANPGYSPDELAFQLENSGAKALATTKAFLPAAVKAAEKAGVPRERILLLGQERDSEHRFRHWSNILLASRSSRYRHRKMDPENDLAFLVYSSGTTGLPKGVMLTHRNVISDICLITGSVGKWYPSSSTKMLGVLPFFHIYGLQGLVQQPLYRGIELVVMPAFDLKTFLSAVQTHRITFIYVAPPVIVRLARDPMVEQYDLSSVQMITSGAAPLTQELVDAVYKRTKIRINQAYGLSETSPMTHTQPWDEWSDSVGSVGKLFPNMVAKYADEEGKEVREGEAGELWLAGPNIFKGYWRNEKATDDCIHIDPKSGLRFFKTGDVGYQDHKQNFYITDRVKELIKYKGFQVAPAELEGKLMDHPLVNDVAVIGVQDKENHTEVPRAYVVHRDGKGSEEDAEKIVKWTAKKVANHKRLRGGVRFVDEVPKSASGKILRRVLKDRAKEEDEKEDSGKVKAKL